jgi:hypothetical protein
VKRIIGIVLAAVLVVGLGAIFVVRSVADRVTDDMLSRAARFSIPADWKLADEIVRPEQFPCISTNPCPSLYRQWEAGKELTEDDVEAIHSGVGFEMTANRPCQRPSNAIGVATICILEGADGEYRYLLTLISPDPNEPHLVALVLEPER